MSKPSIYVRLDFEIRVALPEEEGALVDEEGNPTPEAEERAKEAALSALPQSIQVFIDGEDKDPAEVFLDVSDSDVTEVRAE